MFTRAWPGTARPITPLVSSSTVTPSSDADWLPAFVDVAVSAHETTVASASPVVSTSTYKVTEVPAGIVPILQET